MEECQFSRHNWEPRVQQRPGYERVRFACMNCGAGHALKITALAPGKRKVEITVFPADGTDTISRDLIRWSLASCEDTIRDMERDGISVVRGETKTLGRPSGM